MGKFWTLKENQGIGILELNMPETEVNILTPATLSELREVLQNISRRADLKALLFTSAKAGIFIAGADIKEIQEITAEPDAVQKAEEGKAVFQQIEDLEFPTMAVINGACLGGGYELALACKFRAAAHSEKVKIGLPEVNLGILPGFGGSIRLVRLLGLMKALPLILAGRICSAQDALRNGMVDKLFHEKTLLDDSVRWEREIAEKKFMRKKKPGNFMAWFFENTPPGRAIVFDRARRDVLKRTHGQYPAPLQIIELVRKTCGKKSPAVFRLESESFARLAVTEVSKNLIKLFYMNERYKKLAWTGIKIGPARIRKCGIVGAGVMGGGISQLVSDRQILVRIKDLNEKALGGALKEARKLYEGAVKRRKLKACEVSAKMGLISAGLTDEGFGNCDIVIEAVLEDLKIKQEVFGALSRRVRPDTILASNTSALSVTRMASVCEHPERVIGLHFFNPVNRMPLIEIIRAGQTSEETVERTVQFARGLGKTVIVVRDAAGFLVNRLLMPYLNEAVYLMEEGVPPRILDAVALEFGMPMGPVELIDHVGIDVGYKVAHILFEAFGERMKTPELMEKVKAGGLLGKKSGKGFYVYKGKKKKINPALRLPGGKTAPVSPADIEKRLFYVMINEAARCLEEKIVDHPASVDIGMIMGTGFAPFRAGLLHYADAAGSANILRDLERFQETVDRRRFEPAGYLRELARDSRRFHS